MIASVYVLRVSRPWDLLVIIGGWLNDPPRHPVGRLHAPRPIFCGTPIECLPSRVIAADFDPAPGQEQSASGRALGLHLDPESPWAHRAMTSAWWTSRSIMAAATMSSPKTSP